MRMLILAVLAAGTWAQSLTVGSLPQFLAQAGYQATKSDDTCYTVPEHVAGQSFSMEVCMSTSGKRVWLGAFIKGMSNTAQVNAAAYQRLMLANHEYGPGTFSVMECAACSAATRYKLYYDRPIDNRRLTVGEFQKEVAAFLDALAATKDIWTNL